MVVLKVYNHLYRIPILFEFTLLFERCEHERNFRDRLGNSTLSGDLFRIWRDFSKGTFGVEKKSGKSAENVKWDF